MNREYFAKPYSSKFDGEPLALASEPDSLVEEARLTLDAELQRRNLERPSLVSAGSTHAATVSHWGSRRAMHLASGVAVFLVSALWAVAIFGAFVNASRHRWLTARNFLVLSGLFSVVTVLSFVGAYFLVSSAMKSGGQGATDTPSEKLPVRLSSP